MTRKDKKIPAEKTIQALLGTREFTATPLYGGSDRRFWRVQNETQSYVLLHDTQNEIKRYAKILKYLRKNNISVPAVIKFDSRRRIMIMEDTGNLSLYESATQFNNISYYWKALDELIKIHSLKPNGNFLMPLFSIPDFLFETQYFVRHFLLGLCEFNENINESLLDEFYFLAHKADECPKTLIHRDFQSRNIMIKDNLVKIIDFQGARIGPRAYDLASLLEDPYTKIPQNIKTKLFSKYIASIERKSIAKTVSDSYPYNAIQRLLQATAAFSYLSFVKGKNEFAEFILPAMRRTISFTSFVPGLNQLHNTLNAAFSIARKKLKATSS